MKPTRSRQPRSDPPPVEPQPPEPSQGPGHTAVRPDRRPRDDYERDDPSERAGLRRPLGGTPNVPRG